MNKFLLISLIFLILNGCGPHSASLVGNGVALVGANDLSRLALSKSTDIIINRNEKKLKEKLTNSRNIYLTVNLYQDGQRTFIFDVKGLKKEFR